MECTVVSTWDFGSIAVGEAQKKLLEGCSAIDAVEAGIRAVEADDAAQYFVGKGGLPNSLGKMECDAAVMDHESRLGAVLAIPHTQHAVTAARKAMENGPHNVYASEGAAQFASEVGLQRYSSEIIRSLYPPLGPSRPFSFSLPTPL